MKIGTRTMTMFAAFIVGSIAALSFAPHPRLDHVAAGLAALTGRAVGVVAHPVVQIASGIASSPTLTWTLVGIAALLAVAARLSMGWQADNADEHEGHDIR